jgi:hypothetical protein
MAESKTGFLINTQTGYSSQVNERRVILSEKVRKNFSRAHIEAYILSEFNIDSETMDEHLEELLISMMHQGQEGNLHHQ